MKTKWNRHCNPSELYYCQYSGNTKSMLVGTIYPRKRQHSASASLCYYSENILYSLALHMSIRLRIMFLECKVQGTLCSSSCSDTYIVHPYRVCGYPVYLYLINLSLTNKILGPMTQCICRL